MAVKKKKKTQKQLRALHVGKLGMSEEKFQKYFGVKLGSGFSKKWQ
jgi:hypothetical protein